jgi:hypothetical protein
MSDNLPTPEALAFAQDYIDAYMAEERERMHSMTLEEAVRILERHNANVHNRGERKTDR